MPATSRLLVVTVLVAVCAEFLVDAINDVVEQWHISETFVGLILLPIVGNAAEHVTAVTVAMKNKARIEERVERMRVLTNNPFFSDGFGSRCGCRQ